MTRDLTLLEQLENSGVKVDVDSYHLSWIKAVPFTPHDVTSNQIVIQQQMLLPENKEIIEKTVKEMKDKDWLDIHTVLVSASRVYSYIGKWLTADRTVRKEHRTPHLWSSARSSQPPIRLRPEGRRRSRSGLQEGIQC
jgi:transaldolase